MFRRPVVNRGGSAENEAPAPTGGKRAASSSSSRSTVAGASRVALAAPRASSRATGTRGVVATSGAGAGAGAGASASSLPIEPQPVAEPGSILAAVRGIFDRAGELREDFRGGYSVILNRSIPKKTFAMDLKVRRFSATTATASHTHREGASCCQRTLNPTLPPTLSQLRPMNPLYI